MRLLAAVLIVACSSAVVHAPHGELVQSVNSRDPDRIAALFTESADAELVAGPALHGRVAIANALRSVLARFPDSRIVRGRTWVASDVRVTELVWTATRSGRAIGVAAALVTRVDAVGQIATARLYLDVPTVVGQLDPTKLLRAPIAAPIAGTATIEARGTAVEAANLALANASWARLDAHDPAGVLASVAPTYVYDDLSGPAPLDAAGTRALLDRFLGLVGDFTIVAKPTLFAAGDDVITESVEHMTFQGRSITLHGLDIKHVVAGQVVREWQYANGAEALAALACVSLFVARLASPYREAVTLVELEGLTAREAADMVGVSVSAMKSRVQRGRAQLREMFDRCCEIALDARGKVTDFSPRQPTCPSCK